MSFKQRIEMHEGTTRFQKIIKLWNCRIFGEHNDDAEEFASIDSGVSSRLAALDAALADPSAPSVTLGLSQLSIIGHNDTFRNGEILMSTSVSLFIQ
jgi:hypothetical protein